MFKRSNLKKITESKGFEKRLKWIYKNSETGVIGGDKFNILERKKASLKKAST